MKKLLKTPAKYVFSIIPLALLIMLVNYDKSSPANKTSGVRPVSNKKNIVSTTRKPDGGLPCGFAAQGLQNPDKPTFLTSNDIPVLQCPAGNYPGTTFQIPDAIYSAKQNDQLILQPDGNLVLYCTSCNPGRALWSSQTNGKGGRTLFFQTDGDLVLRNVNGKIIWHSNIKSKCPGSELAYYVLQDDGNLVMLYDESVANSNKVVTACLGSTGSTNNQANSAHPGKIQ